MYRVCEHLLADAELTYSVDIEGAAGTRGGRRPVLVCAGCRGLSVAQREEGAQVVCEGCARRLSEGGGWDSEAAFVGEGVVRVAASRGMKLVREEVVLEGAQALEGVEVLGVAAVREGGCPVWIALMEDLTLWVLDFVRQVVEPLGALPAAQGEGPWKAPLRVVCSDDGGCMAVVEEKGSRGVVLAREGEGLRVVCGLNRGDYHVGHCAFSVAFVSHRGEPRLIHATAWNQLDVMDPRTGVGVTERVIAPYSREQRPAHYLDYFHCRLDVSPSGERVMDAGWVWSPLGEVRAWSVKAWLEASPFESEDGETVRVFAWRYYFWDGGGCWLDERRVALWGFGNDDTNLIPSVWLLDAVDGRGLGWFKGPKQGTMYADGALFVVSREEGLSAWDVDTGERLLEERAEVPLDYHGGARVFLSRGDREGAWWLSRCVWRP
jgi:hypothetical protein